MSQPSNSSQSMMPSGVNTLIASLEEREPILAMDPMDSSTKRFQTHSKKLHLTYRTHLDLPLYLEWLLKQVGPLKWYTMVHELGTKNPEIPYPHTHVAFCCQNPLHLSSARKMDYLGIHPNIKTIKDLAHSIQIWKYHEKDPILLLRSPEGPETSADVYRRLQEAPNLVEAVKIAGITVRTISDVVAIRSIRAERQTIPALDIAYCWTRQAPAGYTALFVTGRTGTGKTRWAIAQFQSPLLVSHLEDLKQFTPNLHDGIVFDDMEFQKLSPTECIHLLDWELPRTLNVKYGSVTIPAKTRKIFTSNISFAGSMPQCPEEQYQALCRRIQIMIADQPLFIAGQLAPAPELAWMDQCDEPAPIANNQNNHPNEGEPDWEGIEEAFPFNT